MFHTMQNMASPLFIVILHTALQNNICTFPKNLGQCQRDNFQERANQNSVVKRIYVVTFKTRLAPLKC